MEFKVTANFVRYTDDQEEGQTILNLSKKYCVGSADNSFDLSLFLADYLPSDPAAIQAQVYYFDSRLEYKFLAKYRAGEPMPVPFADLPYPDLLLVHVSLFKGAATTRQKERLFNDAYGLVEEYDRMKSTGRYLKEDICWLIQLSSHTLAHYKGILWRLTPEDMAEFSRVNPGMGEVCTRAKLRQEERRREEGLGQEVWQRQVEIEDFISSEISSALSS
jgi:hypothetical protein